MFSCNNDAQANISWVLNFQDITIVALYTKHSSTHFYERPRRAQDFDRFPLVFALSLVTTLDANICPVQIEGSREKWYSWINFLCQSSGIMHCNWATIFRPQEGFVLDQLGNRLEVLFKNTRPVAYMEKEIKQTLSIRMRPNFRGSLSRIKEEQRP